MRHTRQTREEDEQGGWAGSFVGAMSANFDSSPLTKKPPYSTPRTDRLSRRSRRVQRSAVDRLLLRDSPWAVSTSSLLDSGTSHLLTSWHVSRGCAIPARAIALR